ncbi:MspA family porin [Mycolicibacterium sp.]|uniref:MspA family porin n=1 Tax=Mycolicibacterium sp. TaxID=2320850 RepID=UPI0025E1C420|nr:MspA family porin [Mycolicibacterium sp.]
MVPGAVRGTAIMAGLVAMVTAAPVTAEPNPGPPGPVIISPNPPSVYTPETPTTAEPAVPATAPSGGAGGPRVTPIAATDPGVNAAEAAPVDDGKVASSPPQTTTAPDGWTLEISSEDETQVAVAPLTTAISTREYAVGGVFNGSLEGPGGGTPEGIFEVGYQIGCGIDMTTSNGVSLTGTAGVNPSIQFIGIDAASLPIDAVIPGIGSNFAGGITVGLKPGLINVVPVTKKQYKGSAPWVSISNFRVKIDGCVGESFIRSYATLTKSTDEGDAILSWYGVTKAV